MTIATACRDTRGLDVSTTIPQVAAHRDVCLVRNASVCRSSPLSPLSSGPFGGENQLANGAHEKVAGTRSDPGDWNSLEFQDFGRAGDGTRTRDVQLGKQSNAKGVVA